MDDTGARDLLLVARRETEQRLAALTGSFSDIVAASESSNADDEHDPEGATIAFFRCELCARAPLPVPRNATQSPSRAETFAAGAETASAPPHQRRVVVRGEGTPSRTTAA